MKRLASELAFAPGQTEPQMWCLPDHTHPELLNTNLQKSQREGEVKGKTVGTETLSVSELCHDKKKQPRANVMLHP